jgi:glycine/D-amino acid oxidase-like deaminating enzyme
MTDRDYRSLSFWHDSLPGSLEPRPALASDDAVDVAIVGAGYTGLWTAYYLTQLQPGIRVAIVEAEIAGYGASGRNGGWCLGNLAGIDEHLSDPARRDGGIRLLRALFETVAEVGRVSEREGIDCHWKQAGTISLASAPLHREKLLAEIRHFRELGFGEDDYRWLEPEECAARLRASRNLGGTFLPHCAALHPARLARGLADVVERRGVSLYERCPARALETRAVVTEGGRLRADTVVRATEGYTATLPGHERALLPIHSNMIATEPLPEATWKEIGLPERETFGDPRRVVIYGQRTADDRMAFGCRGSYFYGSAVRSHFAADDPAFDYAAKTLHSLFPALREHRFTHHWGGTLGVPRDWRPAVGLDRAAGFAWAGGYVGEGVAASNLAGRTLADLILERETERVDLPWVGPRFPSWEPEPLRWIAASAIRQIGEALDDAELGGRSTPRLRGAIFDFFVRK